MNFGFAHQIEKWSHRKVLFVVGLVSILVNVGVSLVKSDGFLTPNTSLTHAQNLVSTGRFYVDSWWYVVGNHADEKKEPLRFYHLPSAPLYQAIGLRLLSPELLRFWHIPFTLLFILSITSVAFRLGGASLSLIAGLVTQAHPWILYHGPAWDDVMIGTSIEWGVVALLMSDSVRQMGKRISASKFFLYFALCSIACLTRTYSRLFFAITIAFLLFGLLKNLRVQALALGAGIVISTLGWGARNYLVSGEFFVNASHEGPAFYCSVWPYARESVEAGGQVEFIPRYLSKEFDEAASLSEAQMSHYFQHKAFQTIFEDPRRFLEFGFYKTWNSVTGMNPTHSRKKNAVALLSFLAVMITSFTGLVLHRNKFKGALWRAYWVLFGVNAMECVALLFLGPIGFRYQLSLVGYFLILSSLAIHSLVVKTANHQRNSSETSAFPQVRKAS